jgi:penicillin-binding protein 2
LASTGARARRPGSNRFLPPDPRVEEPYRFTPQLALRIGILGAVALIVFGILFFRLWALQVLSGPQYLQAALDNQVRSVRLEAQRGEILDRNGFPLVATVPGTAVQLWPSDLPKNYYGADGELAEVRALSRILHVPVTQIFAEMRRHKGDPVTPVVVRESVQRDAPILYLIEHAEQFPGVQVVNTYLRSYPQGTLAAQLLGYVSEVSPAQVKQLKRKGYEPGDKIGQGGLEATYDSYLRGRPGLAQLRVDSFGRPRSQLVVKRDPGPGESIRTTLDVKLQRVAQQAIVDGIQLARNNHHWAANAGAIVAMNPNDGSKLAMAS